MKQLAANILLANMPVGIIVLYHNQNSYQTGWINEIAQKNFGLDEDTLNGIINNQFSNFVHPKDQSQFQLLLYKAGITGGTFSLTLRLCKKDGTYSWTDLHLHAWHENETAIFQLLFIEIDSQKAATIKLEHTYEDLLSVMNNTPGGVVVFDTKNDREPIITFASAGLYRLLHGTAKEIEAAYGSSAYKAIHPEDRELFTRTMENLIRNLSKSQITFRLHTLTGEYILVDALATAIVTNGRRRIYMAVTNATADNEARHLLTHILNMFVHNQCDNIGIIDCLQNSYRILSTNQYTSKIFPRESKDYNRDIHHLIDKYVIKEDQEILWQNVQLSSLTNKMETTDNLEYFAAIRRPSTGQIRYKKFWFSWHDKEAKKLVFIQSDYTEIHDKEREHQEALRTALKAAEQANIAKSVFLSRMSHDIRTPLSAIIGFTNMLLNEDCQPEARKRLEKIEASSEFLLSLINDVLEMSRIESGKFTLQNKPFSMSSLLDGVCSIISAQCETKKLEFHCLTGKDLHDSYRGDQLKLQQILVNILGNSVKFTPVGGSITLAVTEPAAFQDKTLLRFTIADTGIGIAPDFLPHLFDAFAQENSWDAKHTGSGLGLAICKNLVTLMNGTIEVQSEKGKGSTFTVEVQLDLTAAATPSLYSQSLSASPTAVKTKYDFSGKRVLLAEDNLMNQEIAKYILEKSGFTVDVADNGRIACESFAASRENYYDALILDIRMPEMDGLEAAQAIRAMERHDAATIPLIAMSANAFEEDISKSLASGINAHLTKPIDPERLFRTLAEYIHTS